MKPIWKAYSKESSITSLERENNRLPIGLKCYKK